MSRLLAGICLAVTLVWVASFLAPLTPLVPEGYRPFPEVNVALLAVLGFFVELLRRSRKPLPPAADDGNAEEENNE